MPLQSLFAVLLSIFLTYHSTAQNSKLLQSIPETKEAYVRSEANVLKTIQWLNSPESNNDKALRKRQMALLTTWLINSPTVTIELQEEFMNYKKNNSELLIYYMAGWTKYALENNYSKDPLQCNLHAIRNVIHAYSTFTYKKDKRVIKFQKLDEENKLEEWIKNRLLPQSNL